MNIVAKQENLPSFYFSVSVIWWWLENITHNWM